MLLANKKLPKAGRTAVLWGALALFLFSAAPGLKAKLQQLTSPPNKPSENLTEAVHDKQDGERPISKPVAAAVACENGDRIADFSLRAAATYEELRAWKEAEERYLAAGTDACSSEDTRKTALEGVERVSKHRIKEGRFETAQDLWGHAVDSAGAWLLRILVVAAVVSIFLIGAFRVPDTVNGVEVARFVTPTDKKLAGQIESCFVKGRAKILNATAPLPRMRRQITLPIDPGVLSDLSFEAGGFKLAGLASLWRLFIRPLYRITGGGHASPGSITFHAEIWRRTAWFGSSLHGTVIVEVPSPNGVDIARLEDFVYAIFLRVLYAPR